MTKKVIYTAAHSGFNLGQVPLGGGASVCEHLIQEWRRTKPFELDVLGPSLLKESAPQHKDLVEYSEREYARFCQRFERCLTETILRYDPQETVVLCNDVSEGPDFKLLAAKGYSLYTIYHVDVVDYVTSIYFHSLIKPEWTTALYRGLSCIRLSSLVPKILKLIWDKQEASVRYSKGLIVPSKRMKDVLLRCYPMLRAERVHVLPWGVWEPEEISVSDILRESETLKASYPIPPHSWVLLTLSRISPEKGQDRLLRALAHWEKQANYPKEGITLYLAGEAAYMMGKKYLMTLQKLAAKLKRSRIYFVGHVSGAKKKAIFNNADLYVFPSIHESYGLTLLEAMREGKPVLTTPSYGAQEVFKPEFGEMIPECPASDVPLLLLKGLKQLLLDRSRLRAMGQLAAVRARTQRFSETGVLLADILKTNRSRQPVGK